MASVKIVGNSVALISSATLDEIKRIEKCCDPSALALVNDEGETEFKVGTGTQGKITKYGVTYNESTLSEGHYAMVTFPVPESGDGNAIDAVAEKLLGILSKIEAIESGIPDALAVLEADKASVISRITVV